VLARNAREALIESIEASREPSSPRLRFGTVTNWWLARFEAKVATGERRPRTLESHHYHLDHHLLPLLEAKRISALTVDDAAALLDELRNKGRSPKTCAGALATFHSVIRYARRHGWITHDPVDQLERDQRPRPARRQQRVLGGLGDLGL
jgi:site-specific recombinase XerD